MFGEGQSYFFRGGSVKPRHRRNKELSHEWEIDFGSDAVIKEAAGVTVEGLLTE